MKRKTSPARLPALHPRFRIVCGKEIAFGPGKADLLELIAETGSIGKAASRMKMSYMRAWSLVQTMNRCFKKPLVLATHGGEGGGGAELTETGRHILALYRQMERQATEGDTGVLEKHAAAPEILTPLSGCGRCANQVLSIVINPALQCGAPPRQSDNPAVLTASRSVGMATTENR